MEMLGLSLPNTPVSISGTFMAMSSSSRPPINFGDANSRMSSSQIPLPHNLVPQTPLPLNQSPTRGSDGYASRPQSNNGIRSPLPSPKRPTSSGHPDISALSPKSGPPPLISGRQSVGTPNGLDEKDTLDIDA